MTLTKHFAVLSLAAVAGVASAATQPLNTITDSYVTLNTSVLSTNSFTASALGGSTYNSSTGKLTDAVSSVSTTPPSTSLPTFPASSRVLRRARGSATSSCVTSSAHAPCVC